MNKRMIMQVDKTTKGLLLLITIALWGLLVTLLFLKTPRAAHAQFDTQRVIIVGIENSESAFQEEFSLPVTLKDFSAERPLPVSIIR